MNLFGRRRKDTLRQLMEGQTPQKCQHRHVVYGDTIMRYTTTYQSGRAMEYELRPWLCRDCRESGQNTFDVLLEWTKAGLAIYNPDLYLALANPSEIVQRVPKRD